MVIAVGDGAALKAAVAELPPCPATLDKVRIGEIERADGMWTKLTVHTHDDLVPRLRAEGVRGATTLRGVWGFRDAQIPAGDRVLQIRRHVPSLTVIVDAPDRIERGSMSWPATGSSPPNSYRRLDSAHAGRVARRRGANRPVLLSPPETVNTAPPDSAAASSPIRILLVEDDDGDALLVEELLSISGAHVEIVRAETLAGARRENLERVDCVLLDLDLPDAQGLAALHRLKTDRADLAVLVLTGFDDERRGIEAVSAGAQDYLVKGQIDGQGLTRAVQYAVERRRADEARQQLELARAHAEENARLERGLLPAPLVTDPELLLSAHYRPGRRRALLGGDFYDAVQDESGAVHLVVGDVSGHGPDAAALGVCLRIAWRTLVLGGREADQLLPTLQLVHVHERHFAWMFTTLCMATIAPDRRSASIRLAGHPPPLLIAEDRIAALVNTHVEPPLGVVDGVRWTAHEHTLPERWSLLLYTDGRTGVGAGRLGSDGLQAMVRGELDARGAAGLITGLVERAEELNGGPMLDDVAALLVQRR
jgi:serine phosphatase RsbU (regulator of sigma subunit)